MTSSHRPHLERPDWDTARHEAFLAAAALPAVAVPLSAAIGRTAASDIVARCEVPHYPSSAMDGWAVSGAAPWRLVSSDSLAHGEARPIVTGGLVPEGTDGILRSEHGTVTDDGALLDRNDRARNDEPTDRENVRPAGEEVAMSDTVVRAGTALNPAHIAVAAVCGHDELLVLPTPAVGLVLTGNEVVEHGIPAAGHVRDTFGPQLPACVAMLGGEVTSSTRLPDELGLLVAAIERLSDVQVIITTGGTGTSDVDHLHAALQQLEARILIGGVAMRPGGPSLLAVLPDGRFVVGLPGNPLAAMMGVLTLVRPLLAGLAGGMEPTLGTVVTASGLRGRSGLSRLLPYQLQDGVAQTSQWFGSGMLRGLAEADGVLVAPGAGAAAGETVPVLPLPWHPIPR
ncbi:molybdopterin molybdotransferase MoeA [Parafrigoribacterium soli]|uniref:molybdopterin molybdotransferase MoeA n=1 Tax=Parafrigoribacterium soli TaxID=3144663 RepID=UPI0032EC939B